MFFNWENDMTFIAPDHYSYNFKLEIDRLPAIQKDKISGKLGVCGLLLGILFICLGLFDLIYSFVDTQNAYDFNLPDNMSGNELKVKRKIILRVVLLMC